MEAKTYQYNFYGRGDNGIAPVMNYSCQPEHQLELRMFLYGVDAALPKSLTTKQLVNRIRQIYESEKIRWPLLAESKLF